MVTPPPVGTELPSHSAACLGCGAVPHSLRMRFRVVEPAAVAGTVTLDDRHQGAPGIAHGGVVAVLFDEALGFAQVFGPGPAVTAKLTTDYRLPVPIGVPLHLLARLDSRAGRKLHTSGELRLESATGPVAATATALFVTVPESHFARYAPA